LQLRSQAFPLLPGTALPQVFLHDSNYCIYSSSSKPLQLPLILPALPNPCNCAIAGLYFYVQLRSQAFPPPLGTALPSLSTSASTALPQASLLLLTTALPQACLSLLATAQPQAFLLLLLPANCATTSFPISACDCATTSSTRKEIVISLLYPPTRMRLLLDARIATLMEPIPLSLSIKMLPTRRTSICTSCCRTGRTWYHWSSCLNESTIAVVVIVASSS